MKVEIGCGNKRIDDTWATVDVMPGDNVDYAVDWIEGLPFEDNSVARIYTCHTLEHIWWYQVGNVLKEAYRVLIPTGYIEIVVPNFRLVVDSYLGKTCGDSWRKYNEEGSYMKWVNGRIFAYGNLENHHKTVFDREFLELSLRNAGFKRVIPDCSILTPSHGPIDLRMTAWK